jgi:hypothetical protein
MFIHMFILYVQEQEKIAKFFVSNYKKDMLEKELSLKGWNWGTAKFNGSVLSFDVGSNTALEVPLNHVSQCTTGKNEVTLEFHQVGVFQVLGAIVNLRVSQKMGFSICAVSIFCRLKVVGILFVHY